MDAYAKIADDDMMSFYMTDFLCRQFDAFFMKPLGLDKHPELIKDYFGNYEKLIYLAQTNDPELDKVAEKAAQYAAQTERLEQRVRVLERIVTDRGIAVADEIDKLRGDEPQPLN
jgi:ABC-type nitrate/sulfonate/bicarbonate transport system substrate-binding protein